MSENIIETKSFVFAVRIVKLYSTIYCYTGVNATTADKTVTYDANGIPTEN